MIRIQRLASFHLIGIAFAASSVVACVTSPAPQDHAPVDAPMLGLVSTSACPGEDAEGTEIRLAVAKARAMAGVQPLQCDAAASAATEHHCRYVDTNHELTHVETPGRPEFTGVSFADRLSAQGFSAVPSAEVLTSVEGHDAVDGRYGFLNTVYHRAPLLRPYNSSFGMAHDAGCVTIDLGHAEGAEEAAAPDVVWPPTGASHVPTSFVSKFETPNPLPGTDVVGAPVSLLTVGHLEEVQAEMTTADGTKVDAVVLTLANDPAKLLHAGDVHLVPRAPLAAQTQYTVHFHAVDADTGRVVDASTTFTTGDE